MITTISNWYIVSVMNRKELLGEVLWGIIVDDPTCRFLKEDYVCTSQIIKVYIGQQVIKTASGNSYKAIGKGRKASIEFNDFELLRNGFSPKEISMLKNDDALRYH